MVKTLWYSWIF